jgi:hypothetical protein
LPRRVAAHLPESPRRRIPWLLGRSSSTSQLQLEMSRSLLLVATLVDAVEALDPELLDELARAVVARRRSRSGS